MWNVNSSIVNTRPLEVLIIKVCHCNVLFSVLNIQLKWFGITKSAKKNPDSNDSSPISVSLKTKKFLHQTQPEQTTVVPLMRDHKSHLKKRSLKRGLPYLVGNQEVTPNALVPDYPPNKANPF